MWKGKGKGMDWGKGKGWGKDPWSSMMDMMGMMKGGFGMDPWGGKGGKSKWGGDDGWGGGEKKWKPVTTGSHGECTFLTVDASCALVASGGSDTVPAIEYDKTCEVFQSADHILREVIPDHKDSCNFEYDGEWTLFPEVGEAWKALGKEDTCYMIAQCPEQNKWAVGLAPGWKNAERAAKLALAVAVLHETPQLKTLCKNYPEFGNFCKSAGILPGAGKAKSYDPEEAPKATMAPIGSFPEVHWLSADAVPKIMELGLSDEAPAIEWTKDRNSYFVNSANMLKELTGENAEEDVKIEHDADWTEFPEIGPLIQANTGEESCYAVGTCASAAVWAVGIGTNWKARESATKMALSIAILNNDKEKLDAFTKTYPEFGKLAKLNKLEEGPAAKRQKTA